jgi:hypothetical protein
VKLPGLQDFLGCDFEATPLKTLGLRARNALKPWLIRQPRRAMSWRIRSGDGRSYKLLRYHRGSADRHQRTRDLLGRLTSHPAVPALAWSDERHLLVTWVDGATPRMDDPHFARRLGEALARLYRADLHDRPRPKALEPFVAHLHELADSRRLPHDAPDRFAERLEDWLPESIPCGLLCGDQTLANFVLAADGSLFMIDPGSFQAGLPVDLFLMGAGGLYASIDRRAFHEGYEREGGLDFPFRHAEPLAWLSAARQTALQCRVLDATSALERSRRGSLARRIDAGLEVLRGAIG